MKNLSLFNLEKIKKSEISKIKGGTPYSTRTCQGHRDVWEDVNDNGTYDPENGDFLIIL